VHTLAVLYVKGAVEIRADQAAHLQCAVVILRAVLGAADIHPHQDTQLGLQSKTLGARFAVHLLLAGKIFFCAEAVFHTIKTVQIAGGFDARDDKISRDTVAVVRHGHVFDNFRPLLRQDLGSSQHGSLDIRVDLGALQLACLGVGEGDAEIIW